MRKNVDTLLHDVLSESFHVSGTRVLELLDGKPLGLEARDDLRKFAEALVKSANTPHPNLAAPAAPQGMEMPKLPSMDEYVEGLGENVQVPDVTVENVDTAKDVPEDD